MIHIIAEGIFYPEIACFLLMLSSYWLALGRQHPIGLLSSAAALRHGRRRHTEDHSRHIEFQYSLSSLPWWVGYPLWVR
jgi:hypothetical protein